MQREKQKEKEEKEKRNRTIFDNKFELGLDFKLNEANVLDNCPHCGKEINQNKLEK